MALRAAVVGEMTDADTVAAVRATLHRVFESFTLQYIGRHGPHGDEMGLDAGDYGLDPQVRPEAFLGWDERLWPRVRQATLPISTNSGSGR